jgi:hypothetical protein
LTGHFIEEVDEFLVDVLDDDDDESSVEVVSPVISAFIWAAVTILTMSPVLSSPPESTTMR